MDGAPSQLGLQSVLAQTMEAQGMALCDGVAACRSKLKRKNVRALRVAVRRMLGALELATGMGYGAKPRLMRRLGRLMRLLGPLRDAQQIERRAKRFIAELDAAGGAQLGQRLAAEERRRARIARKCLKLVDLRDFQRDVSKVIDELVSAADLTNRGALDAALRGHLAAHHLRIARMRLSLPADDARALHELRLSIKGYRYALDAVASSLPTKAREVLLLAAQLQEQLGMAHDAHVLARSVRAHVNERPELPGMAGLVEALERASQAAQIEGVHQAQSAALDWPFE